MPQLLKNFPNLRPILYLSSWERRVELAVSLWVTYVIIAVHLGFGLVILWGGAIRFDMPTYQPLINLTRGQVWVWGVWSLLVALLLAVPKYLPNLLGFLLGIAWMNTWAAMFAVSMVQYEESAGTPLVAHLGLAMIEALLLTERVLNSRLRL